MLNENKQLRMANNNLAKANGKEKTEYETALKEKNSKIANLEDSIQEKNQLLEDITKEKEEKSILINKNKHYKDSKH